MFEVLDEIFRQLDAEIETAKQVCNELRIKAPESMDHMQAQTFLLGLTKCNRIMLETIKKHREKVKEQREDLKIEN